MSSDTPTPPRGIRPQRGRLMCPVCQTLLGHRSGCWVRAVTVKAAEKTQRGPMVVWFQFFH